MPDTRIYLDYNATAPIKPCVRDAMAAALECPFNPSSIHATGRDARRIVEDARKTVAEAVGAFANEMIFTSGGTEANALAFHGARQRPTAVSAVEHVSVHANAPEAWRIPVDVDGIVRLDALAEWLSAHPGALVSVQHANNETGVIQPVAEISRLVHGHQGTLHCDAAQSFGKIPVNMGNLGVDLLTLCAHKFGGPQGVGALVVSLNYTMLLPLWQGGRQESGHRAGTEPVASIAGFAAAAADIGNDVAHLTRLRDWLDAFERQAMACDAYIFGRSVTRLPNTSLIVMPGMPGETQVMAFDLAGIAVSAGAACASGRVEPSQVLLAMGAGKLAGQGIRISGGWATQESDLCESFSIWRKLYEKTRLPLDSLRIA